MIDWEEKVEPSRNSAGKIKKKWRSHGGRADENSLSIRQQVGRFDKTNMVIFEKVQLKY